MDLTVFVYLFILFIMVTLSYKYAKSKEQKYLFIAISLFVLLTGCRYNVGQDYMLYMQTFLDSANDGDEFWVRNYAGTFELIFSAYIRLCNSLDLPYYFLFIFIAFIQIYFLFKYAKLSGAAFPFIVFFFITCYFQDSMNVMRQFCAFMIILNSLVFIRERCFYKFLLCIIVAFCFHRSSIILLPFYFFVNRPLNMKVSLQIIILFIIFFSSNIMYSYLANTIFPKIEFFLLSKNIGEAYYFSNADVFISEKLKGGFGIASIIALISDVLIISNSNKLKSQYKVNVEYNLYLIGVVFFYIQSLSLTIYRLNLYFTTFKFIMLGYLLFEFIKYKKYALSIFLVAVYIAWYINGIFRGAYMSPYTFIWE